MRKAYTMHQGEVLDGAAGSGLGWSDFDPQRLKVHVLFTTIEGTVAALRKAEQLADGLAMEIVLMVTDVVYFRWSLDHPPVPRRFFEELCVDVLLQAEMDPAEVRIEVFYCRSQVDCLADELRPHSLVVLGTVKRHRLSQERKLEECLSRMGHSVLLIRATPGVAYPTQTGAQYRRGANLL